MTELIVFIIYILTVIICFFIARAIIKNDEGVDEAKALFGIIILMFIPILNIMFFVYYIFDSDVIDDIIDIEELSKKIFFIGTKKK